MTLKLLLLAKGDDAVAALSRHLPRADDTVEPTSVVGDASRLVVEIERTHPDVVVADLPDLRQDALREIERTLSSCPSTALILISPDRSPEFLLQAMRAGVREVVNQPHVDGVLNEAVQRTINRISVLRGGSTKSGSVLAFVPAKGGSGSTFLATNLAYALAQRGRRVAVVDLNLHFGDAALFLSERRADRTIANVAREVSRVDATFLESSMLQVADHLWVLPAPDSPEGAIDVKPEAVEQIIALAKSRFDFVVVDMGRILEAATLRALDQADAIYITVQLTLPFIHDAKRLIDLLRSLGFPREKLRIIVNRFQKDEEITLAALEEALGIAAHDTIPNAYRAVAYSINHGVPVLKSAPRDPVAKAILAMADRVAPQTLARRRWFGF